MTYQQTIAPETHRPLVGGAVAGAEERKLIVRNERFCRTEKPSRHWLRGDPVATAWYNSVSASLPRGETFFIETMQMFRGELPPELEAEVKTFVRQESNHTREHFAFNRLTEAHGYDIASMEKGIEELLALAEGRSKVANLAVMMAMEHFAASLSDQLLRNPVHLAGGEREPVDMWRWHATEEIEHKGLAFDIWYYVTRDWNPFKRWLVRSQVGVKIMRLYLRNRVADALGMMAQDGLGGWRGRWKLYSFLWGRPGVLRRILPEMAKIVLPGFHPWKHDNSHLIRQYRGTHYDEADAVPAE